MVVGLLTSMILKRNYCGLWFIDIYGSKKKRYGLWFIDIYGSKKKLYGLWFIDIYDSAESNLEDRWSVAYVDGIDNSKTFPEGGI